MPRYSIKDIWGYCKEHQGTGTLLLGRQYDPPTSEEETDTRPDYVKVYVDNDYGTSRGVDKVIERDYGDYVYVKDCEDVEEAWVSFVESNMVYLLTHDTELKMVYKAFTSSFNPIENYDRQEETTVHNEGMGNAKTQTSPDDSENFFNVGNADSYSSNTQGTTSRIHGNIGVTEAVAMIDHTVTYFGENSMYDYLIKKLIGESCIIVDYGNNAL